MSPLVYSNVIIIHPHSGWYFSFGHSPNITGGAQVRFLLACQPCICYVYPALSGTKSKPPLCKGRWHFRKKMTEGLLLTSLSSFCSLRSISQSLSLAFARQLPLHKGAFDTIKFCPCFLFAFSSSAEPLLNHATIAWFSLYNKNGRSI